MNASKMIIGMVRRSYTAQKRYSNPGIQKRLDELEDDVENDIESIENLDVEGEPNLMRAHESYTSYKKELAKNKELLKLRIVARKYFNEVEPSLLTHMEKEQIRYLHENNPIDYTPEKLSESFPVLPHTIRKILKAKWNPRSADKVLKHDQAVIENWKKFKRGELPLEPRLREHLQKFKGRIISLPSKEELEKTIVPPEKTFVKPKSQLYSGIIQRYLDQKKHEPSKSEDAIISADEKDNSEPKHSTNYEKSDYNDLMDRRQHPGENKSISKPTYGNEIAISRDRDSSRRSKTTSEKSKGQDFVTLDEFFKDRVKNIDGKSTSVEDRVLLDTYKRKIELENVEENNILGEDRLRPENLDKERPEESDSVTLLTDKDIQIGIEEQKTLERIRNVDHSKETGLETYVKVREKKASQDEEYPERILIPKAKYKKGKLYKLRDCYYDHDGEFLYRVPGFTD